MQAGAEVSQKAEDEELPKEIPFRLGDFLTLKSASDPKLATKAKLLGVIPNIAILVDDPVFPDTDQLEGRIGGDIVCGYFIDGYMFKFRSRFGQYLIHKVVCIDWPKHIDVKKLRKFPRIQVDLETVSTIGNEGKLMNGFISDISQGGCCMNLPGVIVLSIGTPVALTFTLPNDEQVEDIGATVMNLRHITEEKRTIIGLSFVGPSTEHIKVKKFCEMCQYFRT